MFMANLFKNFDIRHVCISELCRSLLIFIIHNHLDQSDVHAKSEVRGRKKTIVIDLLSNRLSAHILCISADIFSTFVRHISHTHK